MPSIAIVAKDQYLAGIYGRKFENDGWEVEVSESFDEGRRKASRMRPSVMLLDVDCVEDAPKTIRALKAMPTLFRTKIVAVAQNGCRLQIGAVRDAGAETYLVLGHFVPREAVAKMRNLLQES